MEHATPVSHQLPRPLICRFAFRIARMVTRRIQDFSVVGPVRSIYLADGVSQHLSRRPGVTLGASRSTSSFSLLWPYLQFGPTSIYGDAPDLGQNSMATSASKHRFQKPECLP